MPARPFVAQYFDGDWVTTFTAAGSTQADAAVLTAYRVWVDTVVQGQGVILQAVEPGGEYTVCNATSVHLFVYPPVGYNFNGATTNAGILLPANTSKSFRFMSATQIVAS